MFLNPIWTGGKKILEIFGKSRWTLYAPKIEVLVETSSNFVCVLMTCKRSLAQVCNLMSIHYDVIIAVFCSFFRTSGLLLFLGMFPHYFCTFFFQNRKYESFPKFYDQFRGYDVIIRLSKDAFNLKFRVRI